MPRNTVYKLGPKSISLSRKLKKRLLFGFHIYHPKTILHFNSLSINIFFKKIKFLFIESLTQFEFIDFLLKVNFSQLVIL